MRSTQESSFRKRHILTAANLTPPCLRATPTTASNISQMLFKSCCTLIKRAGFEKLMSQKKVNDMWVVHSCRGSLSLSTTDVLAELFPDRLLSKLLSLTIDMKCLISRCLRLLVQESYRSRGKNAQREFQRRILSVTDIFETKWNYECCATLNRQCVKSVRACCQPSCLQCEWILHVITWALAFLFHLSVCTGETGSRVCRRLSQCIHS